MSLTVGSLFAGIGGFDLAARWMGWRTVWHSEIDPYASAVFAQHFPESRNVGDVTTWEPTPADAVDLICGGFPCQPVSVAGKRKAQDDERWLWPEFARVLRLLRPRFAVVENVPGLLVRGMGDVLGDLSGLGYDAEWQVVSAAACGARHLRRRVWIVAYAFGALGWPNASARHVAHGDRPRRSQANGGPTGGRADVADTEGNPERTGLRPSGAVGGRGRSGNGGSAIPNAAGDGRESWRTEPAGQFGEAGPLGRSGWESEPDVGRVAHGVPARVDRLRCLGNAIVPHVAYAWAFQRVAQLAGVSR